MFRDDEIRALQWALIENPRAGDVVRGTGGVRKIRVGLEGQGKSGGGRVIYYFVERRGRIYFLLFYPKNVQTELTAEQKKQVRNLVALLEKES
ncbi:MAG: type II toxin-antitoxin system RelE/ParE family toxin [Gemmatimonadetes bacterium]|nr:type II toxin-antitoxin system RelE/ParE family toxin [Gemmatimonadota bacterium]